MRPNLLAAATALTVAVPLSTPPFAQRGRGGADTIPPAPRVAPVPWPSPASWRQIGPAAFGGRIDDIEAVADDPRIIFVGTASGGLFRSRNNGVTWEPVLDAYA